MDDVIVNRVANSGLVTVDLEDYLPKEEIAVFDLKDHLFRGLILKEKDFRETLKNLDWEIYRDKYLAITCSTDAIIPMWAYMLITSNVQPIAKDVYVGTAEEMKKHLVLKKFTNHQRKRVCRSAGNCKRLRRSPYRQCSLCRNNKNTAAGGQKYYVWRGLQQCANL